MLDHLGFNCGVDHICRAIPARLHQQIGKCGQELVVEHRALIFLHVISPADASSHIG